MAARKKNGNDTQRRPQPVGSRFILFVCASSDKMVGARPQQQGARRGPGGVRLVCVLVPGAGCLVYRVQSIGGV